MSLPVAYRERPRPLAMAAVLATLLAVLGMLAADSALGAEHFARLQSACPPPTAGRASCFAVVRAPVPAADAEQAGVHPYTLAAGAISRGESGGLTPEDLESAYDFSSAGGAGQTVAIVDAYDDPNIEADLAAFDKRYGLGECTHADGCFTKVNQEGKESPLPAKDGDGWSFEISLDVETVRSVCRQCRILLVEADNELDTSLAAAEETAADAGATEISNSYGGPEEGTHSEGTASAYSHPGIVITAATGDDGWDDWNLGEEQADAPATLPSVVAVGGTTLSLNSNGTRAGERVWNDYGPEDANELEYAGYATGGGCSDYYSAQPWQRRAPNFSAAGCGGKRLAADVSADADPLSGLDVYDSFNFCRTEHTVKECKEFTAEFEAFHGWHTVGGTSLATPLIAAMYALAGGAQGASYPSLSLYGHLGEASDLYDVTEGGNGFCDDGGLACGANAYYEELLDCEGTTACNAAVGYDGPSGVGSPNGLGAFKPRLPIAAITPPSSPVTGQPASFSGASSSDPYTGAAIAEYTWNWGDGTADGSGADPTHTYAAPGEYTVTLTVTDEYGLTDTTTAVVDVHTETVTEREAKEKAEREAHEKAELEAHEKAEREAKEKAEREAHEKAELEAHEKEVREKAEAAKELEEATQKAEREAKEKAKREAIERAEREGRESGERAAREAAELKKHEEEQALATKGLGEVAAFKVTTDPDATLASTRLKVSRTGTVSLQIRCPSGESSCMGTVVLRTRGAVSASLTGASTSRASVLTLATGSFTVAGGKQKTIALRLSSRARSLLRRSGTLPARATIAAHDTAGASHTTVELVTLRLSRG